MRSPHASSQLRPSLRLAVTLALSLATLGSAAQSLRAASPGGADPDATTPASPCPTLFSDLGPGAAPQTCLCTAAATRTGPVFGSDIYSDDSAICRAAIHTGELSSAGGPVTIYPLQGLGNYDGTIRHGVRSLESGSHGASFAFRVLPDGLLTRQRCQLDGVKLRGSDSPVTCHCSSNDVLEGSVWGTDVYSEESNICRAAVHAGVIPTSGGMITVIPAAGMESYAGSDRRKVTSANHGASPGSFRFAPPPAATAP